MTRQDRDVGQVKSPIKKAEDAAQYSFSSSIVYWARILEALYNRAFLDAIKSSQLTIGHWRVLACLAELEPLTVGEIAGYTHMERTVLSRLLDRMAQEGYILREVRSDDRRVSEAHLTEKGRHTFEWMRPLRQQVYEQATRGLSRRETEFVRQTLISMVDNLGGERSVFTLDAEPDR